MRPTEPSIESRGARGAELTRLGHGGALPDGALVAAHRRFARIVREQPGAQAIVTKDVELTYEELDSHAEHVAQRLPAAGVGREDIVGICLPQRLDALIAIYGVLKAGAAYLPLDVAQPLDRRRFMLRDAGAAALITVPEWERDLRDGDTRLVPWTGRERDAHGATADAGAADDQSLDDLAYVIYTSGSTGRPKAVMIEHRSLAAFVHWGVSAFSRDELRSVFAATAFGFDMSLFELTVPFAAGGRLVLADNFFEIGMVGDREVTLVNTVPSLMAAALDDLTLPATVGTAVFCGETLPFEVSERVHQQPGVRRVVNAYGPTEDTVYSTAAEVLPGERPTCGRPFAGTQVHILDADLQPVERGAEGEICLGGTGLARGYLGREELTRERFVEAPLGPDGPPRLYRTGDLGRWEEDGSLQHLGRLDHQIKVRGVRIEPGEIEDALVRHPGVRQAVVTLRERSSGGKALVAYMVCAPGADPSARELRDALRERLPEPMVPALFVRIDEMPLNANGKLDRARLPEPRATVDGSAELSPLERDLAELWRELLKLDGLPGPDDDFFELGGDSLLAFKMFEHISAKLKTELSPSVLVQASTIGGLASWIESAEVVEGRAVVALHADGARIPCFYVQSGAGGILALRNFAAAFGVDQPLYGIQAFRDDDVEGGDILGVEATAAQCVPIVRERQPRGPYVIAGHSIGGHIAYELACRLEAEGEEVVYLGLLDPPAPHTLRWRGRVVARLRDLTGTGPEPRRRHVVRATLAKARRYVRSRVPVSEAWDGDAPADRPTEWMRNLNRHEKRYRPARLTGSATVYTTAEITRATGSRTLGWDRYVAGPLTVRRVPGGHVSLLLDPNVAVVAEEMAADIRTAQRRASWTPEPAGAGRRAA
jgi:amino acid adenylation domain-containing protein